MDIRLITATNKELLRKKYSKDPFRDDLYYRISVFPLNLPPLRITSRTMPLVDHFIKKFNKQMGKSIQGIAETSGY